MKEVITSRILRTIPLMLIIMLLCPFAYGKVIYVDDNVTGANDGTSWENAYVFLQDALADANDSDKPVEIRVAQGIYKPDLGGGNTLGDRRATFQLINDVIIKGGFAGLDADVRDVEAYRTILSGDLNGDDVEVADPCDLLDEPTRAENSYTLVISWGTDATAVLDGCTITSGNANSNLYSRFPPVFFDGGGMRNVDSSATVTRCTFTGNSARVGGGMSNAGWVGDCNVTIMKCVFRHNAACDAGGMANMGYFLGNCNPTITDCTFSENWARNAGGMLNRQDYLSPGQTDPIVVNCTFSGNSAMYSGGGMCNDNSSSTLSNCTFAGNWVESNDGEDEDKGGGMYNLDSSPTLSNCTFIGNSADEGGGMCNANLNPEHGACNPTLTNCTFSGNSARYGGGGMRNQYASNPTLTNCILWGDTSEVISVYKGTVVITYSNVQGGFPGEGNIDVDPLFADPGYWDPNGTPDDTNDDFWVEGDYHLKSQAGRWEPVSESWVIEDFTSPCIDAGDPNSPLAFEPFPNGGIINMGAYGGTAEASKSPSGLHTKYGGGTGGPNDPYLIYTAEQMNEIGLHEEDWNKHFKLMADIDLSTFTGTDFNIIGTNYDNPFTGVFDGNGHRISNFSYTSTDTDDIGLFGYVSGKNAVIKDVGLIDPNIDAGTRYGVVGSLVSYISDGTISNCYAEGGSVSGNDRVGGLVGWNESTITNCYSVGSVTGDYDVGGLVGYNAGLFGIIPIGTITDCYANSSVSGTMDVGGLVGINSGTISNCYAIGPVSGGEASVSIGGLVGFMGYQGCFGITPSGIITDCYATGPVSGGQESSFVGGLVGESYGIITHSYASGSVSTGDTGRYLGGLVGGSGETTIDSCYFRAPSDGGGPDNGVGLPLTDEQMKQQASFVDWDFMDEAENGTEDIWQILEGQDYPRLWWELIEE